MTTIAYPNQLIYGRTTDDENVPILVDASGKIILAAITGSFTVQNLIVSSMPTTDPHVVGQLWNSSGTVHISAG